MQTYQKTTSVIFTITLLFLLLSIFVKSYIVAIVGLVVGALVSWIPIVAFNQMFDDIARVLFSIPRESDVWWKWLLVFLFGLLIEGMLIASYIIYLKNLGTVPGTKEAFGGRIPPPTWNQETQDKINYFKQNESTINNLLYINKNMDQIKTKYSNNADVLNGLSALNEFIIFILVKLNGISNGWEFFKKNMYRYYSPAVIEFQKQYDELVSLKAYIALCVDLLNQLKSHGYIMPL